MGNGFEISASSSEKLPEGRVMTARMSLALPIPDSRFPIPDSRFPIPDSRFPIPDSRFPIPGSQQPKGWSSRLSGTLRAAKGA
jgi:hypothetical protein